MRLFSAAMGAAILFVGCFASVSAQEAQQPSSYTGGFSALHKAIGSQMGRPLEAPQATIDGNVEQLTTEGLAYWLHDTNTPTFFNGVDRWALTDHGLVHWTGDQEQPPLPSAPAVVQSPDPGLQVAGLSPQQYLYATAPSIAADLNCIITRESGWNPLAKNPRSTATGLAQFLTSTYYGIVPASVRQGRPPTDPFASIDAAIWLYTHVGRTQWEVVTKHLC